jgi:capsid assembly protease
MKRGALDSFYNTPLAISEAKLAEIEMFLEARESGLPPPQAFQVELDASRGTRYQVNDGVAVLSVDGVLAPKMNLLMQFSGGTSTQMLANDFADALARPEVCSILFEYHTPGGIVFGISALAEQIYAARGKKPIAAALTSQALSGGYWLAAAADEIFMTENTAVAGSIGVVMVHRDVSKAEAAMGVKTTEIYSGKYKRLASSYAPLSEQGRTYLQDQTDYLYSLFVEAVANYRGVSVEQALANMAEGQMFIGQRAVDAGLVDGIESFDSILNRLSAKKPTFSRGLPMAKAASSNEAPGVEEVDAGNPSADGKKASAPAAAPVAAAAPAPVAADNAFAAQTREAGRAEGTKAERERVLAILSSAPAGYEANALEAIEGGVSAAEFSMSVLKEMKDRGVSLGAMRADAPNVPFAAVPSGETKRSASALVPTDELYEARRRKAS